MFFPFFSYPLNIKHIIFPQLKNYLLSDIFNVKTINKNIKQKICQQKSNS